MSCDSFIASRGNPSLESPPGTADMGTDTRFGRSICTHICTHLLYRFGRSICTHPSHGGPSVGDATITSPCVQGREEKGPGQGDPCRMLEDGGAPEQWERKWPLMWKLSFRKHNDSQRSFINMAIVAPSLWWEQMVRALCSVPPSLPSLPIPINKAPASPAPLRFSQGGSINKCNNNKGAHADEIGLQRGLGPPPPFRVRVTACRHSGRFEERFLHPHCLWEVGTGSCH